MKNKKFDHPFTQMLDEMFPVIRNVNQRAIIDEPVKDYWDSLPDDQKERIRHELEDYKSETPGVAPGAPEKNNPL